MRILGIDPGTANCGFALLEARHDGPVVLDLGCFTSNPDTRLRDRVAEMVGDVDRLLSGTARPDIVIAEAPAFPTGAKAAAMVWAAFAGLSGLCQAHVLELVLRNPGEWRKLLGLPTRVKAESRLRKNDTRDLMEARFPGAPALLASTPAGAREHAFDALAIAVSWIDRATTHFRDGTPRAA